MRAVLALLAPLAIRAAFDHHEIVLDDHDVHSELFATTTASPGYAFPIAAQLLEQHRPLVPGATVSDHSLGEPFVMHWD